MCSTLVSEGDLGLHSDGDNVFVWQCAGDGWVDMRPGLEGQRHGTVLFDQRSLGQFHSHQVTTEVSGTGILVREVTEVTRRNLSLSSKHVFVESRC